MKCLFTVIALLLLLPVAHAEEVDYNALSLPELTQMAEAGDAEAQYSLEAMYAMGRGVPQDYQQAAQGNRTRILS
ncbi:MAG: hypothetical protein FWG81_09450 [Betaproteobacteria bacterium]|nr:hypothetical protein [Betaproteobacteria bacterium]